MILALLGSPTFRPLDPPAKIPLKLPFRKKQYEAMYDIGTLCTRTFGASEHVAHQNIWRTNTLNKRLSNIFIVTFKITSKNIIICNFVILIFVI